jgi:hypothetical protein
MDATAVRQQMTDSFLREIEDSKFPNLNLLDRVESMISTREELERYTEILVAKATGDEHPSGDMLDRVERLLKMLQHLDRLEVQAST